MPSFETVRFGVLEYDEADVITLPAGLVGLGGLRRWLMLDMGEDLPLQWLQSLDRSDFGFPVTAPLLFREDYDPQPGPGDRKRLQTTSDDDLVALVITTVHPGGDRITGNLRAPLIVDTETRRGIQLTLDDDRFGVQQEIDYFKFGLAVGSNSSENDAAETTGAAAEHATETASASL